MQSVPLHSHLLFFAPSDATLTEKCAPLGLSGPENDVDASPIASNGSVSQFPIPGFSLGFGLETGLGSRSKSGLGFGFQVAVNTLGCLLVFAGAWFTVPLIESVMLGIATAGTGG